MRFDAELPLLALAPVSLACIDWEARHLRRARPNGHIRRWAGIPGNTSLALMRETARKLAQRAVIGVPAEVRDRFRLPLRAAWRMPFAVLFITRDPHKPDTHVFPSSRRR